MYKTIKETTVTVPATARLGYGRDAEWHVTIGHLVTAHARTLPEARAAAVNVALDYVSHSLDKPAFARDDDGSWIVVVPEGSGSSVWRLNADSARNTAYVEGSPADYVARVHHYTPVNAA